MIRLSLFHPAKSKNQKQKAASSMTIKNNRNSGFTLVEIMIVVAIIGLLAAIAIPNFVRARETSQKNACINNLRQIDGAIQQHALEAKKAATDTCAEGDVTPYLKQGAGTSCPLDSTSTFATSYTVSACNVEPICQKNGTDHVLP
jgi:prepilin-type N-terminal cleavage/methylation domain-containing protein